MLHRVYTYDRLDTCSSKREAARTFTFFIKECLRHNRLNTIDEVFEKVDIDLCSRTSISSLIRANSGVVGLKNLDNFIAKSKEKMAKRNNM